MRSRDYTRTVGRVSETTTAEGGPTRWDGLPAGWQPGRPLDARVVLQLQRLAGNQATASLIAMAGDDTAADELRSPVHDVVGRGGGRPLDARLRSGMEAHLGHDLSSVRVHIDALSTESVAAKAFTVGDDIVIHPAHYFPGTASTQHTLAHELTHVLQQRSGPVAGAPTTGGIALSHPSDPFERAAEESARAVVSSAPPEVSSSPPARTGSAMHRLAGHSAVTEPPRSEGHRVTVQRAIADGGASIKALEDEVYAEARKPTERPTGAEALVGQVGAALGAKTKAGRIDTTKGERTSAVGAALEAFNSLESTLEIVREQLNTKVGQHDPGVMRMVQHCLNVMESKVHETARLTGGGPGVSAALAGIQHDRAAIAAVEANPAAHQGSTWLEAIANEHRANPPAAAAAPAPATAAPAVATEAQPAAVPEGAHVAGGANDFNEKVQEGLPRSRFFGYTVKNWLGAFGEPFKAAWTSRPVKQVRKMGGHGLYAGQQGWRAGFTGRKAKNPKTGKKVRFPVTRAAAKQASGVPLKKAWTEGAPPLKTGPVPRDRRKRAEWEKANIGQEKATGVHGAARMVELQAAGASFWPSYTAGYVAKKGLWAPNKLWGRKANKEQAVQFDNPSAAPEQESENQWKTHGVRPEWGWLPRQYGPVQDQSKPVTDKRESKIGAARGRAAAFAVEREKYIREAKVFSAGLRTTKATAAQTPQSVQESSADNESIREYYEAYFPDIDFDWSDPSIKWGGANEPAEPGIGGPGRGDGSRPTGRALAGLMPQMAMTPEGPQENLLAQTRAPAPPPRLDLEPRLPPPLPAREPESKMAPPPPPPPRLDLEPAVPRPLPAREPESELSPPVPPSRPQVQSDAGANLWTAMAERRMALHEDEDQDEDEEFEDESAPAPQAQAEAKVGPTVRPESPGGVTAPLPPTVTKVAPSVGLSPQALAGVRLRTTAGPGHGTAPTGKEEEEGIIGALKMRIGGQKEDEGTEEDNDEWD